MLHVWVTEKIINIQGVSEGQTCTTALGSCMIFASAVNRADVFFQM